MTVENTVRTLEELLDASRATEAFKAAVRALADGRRQDCISANPGSPPVKILRFIMKLLELYPDETFSSVEVDADSSCSGFTGTAVARPGELRFEFDWDCAWRAREEGWKDAYGDPDQIRAARTLGYQCFRRFEKV
jgi:hypothetical protein